MKCDKLLRSLVTILLIVTIPGLTFAQTTPKPMKPLKIGVSYSLTGIFSAAGIDTCNGVLAWIELENGKGGIKGHPIEFFSLDDQSDPTKAALTAKKLIETRDIHALVGSASTMIALAVGPVCEKAGIPYVAAAGSEVFEQTLKPHWSFRVCSSSWEDVDWGFGALKLLNPQINHIGVLYQGAAQGKSAYANAERYAPARGFKIVAGEKYDPAGSDFGGQVSSIMRTNPDAVAVYCADMAGPLAIKQMREMGMNKPIVSLGAIAMRGIREAFKDTFSIPPYVYSAGSKADVWAQLPKDSPDYKVLAPVAAFYEKKYKDQYTFFPQQGANALILITDSLKRALNRDPNLLDRDTKTIRTAIRDGMETIKDVVCGGIMTCRTPKNHNVLVPGSGKATFHFEKGKIIYDPELSKTTLNPPPPTVD